MKHLLSLVFLLNSLSVFAQEPAYTPMRLNYQFRGIKVDSLFLVPSYTDTTQANNYTAKNIPGSLIRTGSDFWMRNGTATAWLQNVNVGPGASPVVQFVDSVWRVAGKDSIFWRKAGVTNKIKDSVPPNSPERIAGTATTSVTANMASNELRFNNVSTLQMNTVYAFVNSTDSVRIKNASLEHLTKGNNYTIKDFNNTFLEIDTLGNSIIGDITQDTVLIKVDASANKVILKAPNPIEFEHQNYTINSQLLSGHAVNGIDLNLGDYNIEVPGLYIVSSGDGAGGNKINLPDPALYKGQMCQIINTTGATEDLGTNGGSVYDRGTASAVTTILDKKILVAFSDGTDWYSFAL